MSRVRKMAQEFRWAFIGTGTLEKKVITEITFIPPEMTYDCMRILDECRKQMNLVYPFEV